jgi:hypothetical protein
MKQHTTPCQTLVKGVSGGNLSYRLYIKTLNIKGIFAMYIHINVNTPKTIIKIIEADAI